MDEENLKNHILKKVKELHSIRLAKQKFVPGHTKIQKRPLVIEKERINFDDNSKGKA
ncbi:hypothetical protein KY320_01645 [Candidatus Woesearchaeota archaeon]|nr:hypothetical protein [Candidatus Woesearchaeota archaeon]